jgi:probable rRNA maturation factor
MDSDGPSSLHVEIGAPVWRGLLVDPAGVCRRAIEATLERAAPPAWRARAEIGVVLADDAAARALNAAHRGQDRPTNVLSFPMLTASAASLGSEPGDRPLLLGDIVLAAETIRAQAITENKPLTDHVLHLVVHGTLHLLGHDHEDDAQAVAMEELERSILAGLGVPDPYAEAPGAREALP